MKTSVPAVGQAATAHGQDPAQYAVMTSDYERRLPSNFAMLMTDNSVLSCSLFIHLRQP